MTCDDARDLVKLDAPCAVGSIYPTRRLTDADTVALEFQKPDASRTPRVRFPLPDAVYPVGGQAAASWIPTFSSLEAVLIVDQWRTDNNSLILVTTDGNPRSLRRVIEGLRNRPEESYATTQAALTTGIYEISLIYFPYLFVMATTAAGMAAVTLLYAVLLLFRQRHAEFRMLRCQGATRMLLAVDLGLLFAVPLILAFGLAIASGAALAVSYNTAFGVPAPPGNPQAVSILAIMLAVGMTATALIAWRATRVTPLVTDPDAAAA